MKNFSIVTLIIIFLCFLGYETQRGKDFQVLKVMSPDKVVVDLNQNGIQDTNEIISVKTESFAIKNTPEQTELVKKIKISESDGIGIGYFAQNFAQKVLAGKKIELKNNNSKIIINNQDYNDLLIKNGLALKNGKITKELFKTIDKARKLNLVIYNNKSSKYHKLDCKYGLMAHNITIVPLKQLPKDAKPCKFCFGKKKYKKYKYNYIFTDIIPNIKQPPIHIKTNSIELFLTDLTKVKVNNNCNTQVCQALLREINSSNTSIDFAIYGYTKIPQIQQALFNAQNRGVKIRFVYDSNKKNINIYPDTNYLAQTFTDNNHDLTDKIMHNKFFIIDRQKVFTGSANISNTDMSGFNSNAILIINSPEIAEIYEKEFEQMYAGRFHKQKRKIKNKTKLIDDTEISLYFLPKDKAITNNIIPLIDQAHKYIYIPAFLITHKEMTNALISAAHRGVAVKIILDATNTHSGSRSKMKALRAAKIPVKTEIFAGKLHSKSIIIDDTYTIIGSMNFSKSGEQYNDENLVIIKNSKIAVFYKTFFQYLWKRIPEKWLKYNARAESPESIGSCSDGIDNDFDGKIDKADDSCKPIKYKHKRKILKKKHTKKKYLKH